MTRIYILTHEHRYGTSVYPFRLDDSQQEDFPLDAEDVAERLEINFEPERSEYLSIGSFAEHEVVILPARAAGPA